MNIEDALNKLIEGNKRYTEGRMVHPDCTTKRRKDVTENGQHPFVAVVACSDSRVPVELIFDQGVGNVFVIRNAGNYVDESAISAVEYAVDHLNVPLVLILGHKHCGAVTATVNGYKKGDLSGYIANQLKTSIIEAESLDGDFVDNSVRVNVKNSIVKLLNSSEIVNEMNNQEKTKVIGGYYDIETGEVSFSPIA